MKIIHISYSDYIGGASRAALRIHNSLLKKKINSTLLVIKKSKKNNKKVFQIKTNKYNQLTKILINKIFNLLFPGKTSILSLNVFGSGVLKYINKSNFDIVHLHWINNEVLSINEIKKIKSKIIWTCHDMWPFGGAYHYFFQKDFKFNMVDKFIYNLKQKKLSNKNIFFVGVSKWVQRSINKYIKYKNFKSFTVNNPINERFWIPFSKKIIRKKPNIHENYFSIGIGSVEEGEYNRKGKDIFKNILEKLKKKSKIKFKIIEFGNKNINFIAPDIDIINNGFINNDKKIRDIYNSMDLLILPSKLEAFGQVASEAILCGTPVLGFKDTGLDDIIIHKKNGWLANKYKIKDFIDGIDFFYKYKKNKEVIRRTILYKFSYNKIAKKYIDIYKIKINEKN